MKQTVKKLKIKTSTQPEKPAALPCAVVYY